MIYLMWSEGEVDSWKDGVHFFIKQQCNPTSLCLPGSLDGSDPAMVQSSSRTLTPGESSEDSRLHMDDEDYTGESSGST